MEHIRSIQHKGSRMFALAQRILETKSFVQEPKLFELEELLKYSIDWREYELQRLALTIPPLEKKNNPRIAQMEWLESVVLQEMERRIQLERAVLANVTPAQKPKEALQIEHERNSTSKIEEEYFRSVFNSPEKNIPDVIAALKYCGFIDENEQWNVSRFPNPLAPIMAFQHFNKRAFFNDVPRVVIERAFCERFRIKRPKKGFEFKPDNKKFKKAKEEMERYLEHKL